MSHRLPRRANSNEIVSVKGYEGKLFILGQITEEVVYDVDGTLLLESVIYHGTNIDNRKNVEMIYDEDILQIVVTADKSDKYIEERQKNAGLPLVQPEQPNTLEDLMRRYTELAQQRRDGGDIKKEEKPAMSVHEEKRRAAKKERDYIDFLLDNYIDLSTLQAVLGEDEERTFQMNLIKTEFEKRTGKKIDEKSAR